MDNDKHSPDTQIPDKLIEKFAHALLPLMKEYYASEAGKADLEAYRRRKAAEESEKSK